MRTAWAQAVHVFFAITILASATIAAGIQGNEGAKAALKCLLTKNWVRHDLAELGVGPSESLAIRYTTEAIPGTSPNSEGVLKIFVYDRHGRNAWLLFARKEGSDYVAVHNAYRLKQSNNGWSAGEGNGGVAAYEAIGRFAAHVYGEQREIRIAVKRGQRACPVQD